MNTIKFRQAYNESRNGANEFYRHSLVRAFHYSDGVRDCAQAGCYWLLDIAATEFPAVMRKQGQPRTILEARVKSDETCELVLKVADDEPPIWSRSIDYTDMPEGTWYFEVVDKTVRVAMILLTEH